MSMAYHRELQAQVDAAIAAGRRIQVQLEGMAAGHVLGPAEIKNHGDGCYTIIAEVQMGDGPRAVVVRSPMTFTIDRIVWFSTGPVDQDGKPLVDLMGPHRISTNFES